MNILVFAEHNGAVLNPATLCVISAAKAIGGSVDLLIAGWDDCAEPAATAASIPGINKVFVACDEAYDHQLAENISLLLAEHGKHYTHILAAASTTGKNIMPRVAALLGVEQISDIIGVESVDTFKRPIYAGNAIATVQSSASIKVITVRPTAFEKAPEGQGNASIEQISVVHNSGLSRYVSEELASSDRPELAAADIIVSGGRGMGSGDNFEMLYSLADKLGAAVGASRAAVDAGFVPNDMQVGQTGKVVAPELYVAVGISGAIQHLAGMKESKIIVAINKDEEAPIFQVADYGLVTDLFDALPALSEQL